MILRRRVATRAMSPSKVTAALARWAAECPRRHSGLARRRARQAILDAVGCMVAGAGDAGAAAVRRTALAWGEGRCTVVGAPRPASAPWAAMANGMAAHVLDFDDNYHPASTHASAVLLPALLALAEERDLPGRRLLDAFLVGLEMHALVAQGVNRIHYDSGWHGTSTIGTIGTAAACGRLLGFDARTMGHAISLGVSMASGTKVQFGSDAKPFHAGMAAKNAVLAACLAEQGATGGEEPLDGHLGFRALYAGPTSPGWRAVLRGLGRARYVERFGLAPKLYPCCGSAHRTLDGLLALMRRHGFMADDVASVDTLVGFTNHRNLMYPDPRNEREARFSMHYCVAVALRSGRLSLADFTPAAVWRPEVRRLLPLTRMTGRPQRDEHNDPSKKKPVLVTVTLKDGRVMRTSVRYARGTVFDPFDDGDLDAKFLDCAQGFLTPSAIRAVRDGIAGIDRLASLRPLARRLRFAAGADRGERFARRLA